MNKIGKGILGILVSLLTLGVGCYFFAVNQFEKVLVSYVEQLNSEKHNQMLKFDKISANKYAFELRIKDFTFTLPATKTRPALTETFAGEFLLRSNPLTKKITLVLPKSYTMGMRIGALNETLTITGETSAELILKSRHYFPQVMSSFTDFTQEIAALAFVSGPHRVTIDNGSLLYQLDKTASQLSWSIDAAELLALDLKSTLRGYDVDSKRFQEYIFSILAALQLDTKTVLRANNIGSTLVYDSQDIDLSLTIDLKKLKALLNKEKTLTTKNYIENFPNLWTKFTLSGGHDLWNVSYKGIVDITPEHQRIDIVATQNIKASPEKLGMHFMSILSDLTKVFTRYAAQFKKAKGHTESTPAIELSFNEEAIIKNFPDFRKVNPLEVKMDLDMNIAKSNFKKMIFEINTPKAAIHCNSALSAEGVYTSDLIVKQYKDLIDANVDFAHYLIDAIKPGEFDKFKTTVKTVSPVYHTMALSLMKNIGERKPSEKDAFFHLVFKDKQLLINGEPWEMASKKAFQQ